MTELEAPFKVHLIGNKNIICFNVMIGYTHSEIALLVGSLPEHFKLRTFKKNQYDRYFYLFFLNDSIWSYLKLVNIFASNTRQSRGRAIQILCRNYEVMHRICKAEKYRLVELMIKMYGLVHSVVKNKRDLANIVSQCNTR